MSARLGPLERSERLLGFAMLAPAAALLGLVVVVPVWRLLVTSTLRLDQGTRPEHAPFVGLENFADALADERFWDATLHTLAFVVVTVPGALIVGLALALLANLPFRVRWPVRLGLLLPWALPVVFAGLIFRWFFEYRQGVVNDLLGRVGIDPLQWLSAPRLAFAAICLAIVWKSSSFVALVLLAGLQAIPRELYEAAEVDGAGAWQRFRRVTLPMLRP